MTKNFYFTDPDDITGQRMIEMKDFLKNIEQKNLMGNPFFFNGVVLDSDDKEMFDYMLTKGEDLK